MADRNIRVTLRADIKGYIAALKNAAEATAPKPDIRDFLEIERDDDE